MTVETIADEMNSEDLPETAVTPPPKRRNKPVIFFVTFVLGLALGWFVVGWWLWPISWINAEPQHLSPEYQGVYIRLVAAEYALTNDLGKVHSAFEKWEEQKLADTISVMIIDASSTAERERLLHLAEALAMPNPDLSLTEMLSGQAIILVSVVISVLFFGVALGMVFVPRIQQLKRSRRARMATDRIVAEVQAELGDTLSVEDIFEVPPEVEELDIPESGAVIENDAAEPSDLEKMVIDAEEEVVAEESAPTTGQDVVDTEEDKVEEVEKKPDEVNKNIAGKKEKEQKKGSQSEDEAEIPAPLADEDDPYLIIEDEEEEENELIGGDGIFDLFEEEDESAQEIENLAKQLPEVDLQEILNQLEHTMFVFSTYERRQDEAAEQKQGETA